MRKWAISEYHRQFMVDEVFKAGYASEEELQTMQRWTRDEMLELCDDRGLLSLFQRYVIWYPKTPERDKMAFEKDIEAEIAIDELLQ